MNEKEYLNVLEVEYKFKKRKYPLLSELRPDWKLAVLVLILNKCCVKNTASFQKVQVLIWAVKNKDNRQSILKLCTNKDKDIEYNLLIRYEPSVNRIIDIALAEKYIELVKGNRIRLTIKGSAYANEIEITEGLFVEEKDFFQALGKKLSEKLLNDLTKELKKE